jgi:DNA processing protein
VERDELAAWLRLTLTPGVGNATVRKLLAAFGLPQAVFAQSEQTLRHLVSAQQATALLDVPAGLETLAERTWHWLEETNGDVQRRVATLGDATYPVSLLHIEDPPMLLYLMGQLALPAPAPAPAAIAIVGSRNPTPQGESNARQFAHAFAQAGLTVISGLALGIDGAAHAGALQGAEASGHHDGHWATIAVVGTGLDRVYPGKHRDLAHRIARHGLLISEYPLGTPPLSANFPKRNRIISGLSLGTLVVEAALKSGSLITARLASEQGKDIFAIPGSIHAAQSRGCHALIKQGAKLVESPEDVLEELRPQTGGVEGTPLSIAENNHSTLGNGQLHHESALLEALGFDPVGLDALLARTGLDTARLQAALLELELDGAVARLPGGLFQRQGTA